MKLLTPELRASLPPLYAQEKVADPVVHAKFFTPDSNWTWYVKEGEAEDDDFRFFGYGAGISVRIVHSYPAAAMLIVLGSLNNSARPDAPGGTVPRRQVRHQSAARTDIGSLLEKSKVWQSADDATTATI
jgi:hypothetical protein